MKICWLLLLMACFATVSGQESSYQQGVLYVKIVEGSYTRFDALFQENETILSYHVSQIEQPFKDGDEVLKLIYRIHFDATKSCDSLVHFLSGFSCVDYAERIPVYRLSYHPNDLIPINQWSLPKVNAEAAWDISKGSSNVVIAVVDNAVRITHHDLAANIWTNEAEIPNNGIDDDGDGYTDDIHGWDVADHDNNPNPPAGFNSSSDWNHGTHVSGIASAVTDNALGVASLGFGCKIMAVKCAPDTSTTGNDLPNPYDGVYYAVKAHANIINMSFSSSTPSNTDRSMTDFAYNSGLVCVAAAGNDNNNSPRYPAAYRHVIAVGATGKTDLKSGYSNYGSYVSVMAPGDSIKSTIAISDLAYGYLYGTSMASPMVCGLAGLILSVNPKLNPDQVAYYIKAGCDNIDALNPAFTNQLGAGRINAYNSLKLVQQDTAKFNANAIINIFPNPSGSTCNIRFLQRWNGAPITIILKNLLGQPVLQETVTNFIGFYYPLNLYALPQGLYFTQIILPDTSLNTIIIKAAN